MFKFLLIVAILALSISNSLQQYDEEVVSLDGSSPSAAGDEYGAKDTITWINSEGKTFEIPFNADENVPHPEVVAIPVAPLI